MESGTSDLTVVPNQEGDESSMVLGPSIQASLQRTSSVVSENIAAGDDLSAGMESSICVASSKNSEIIEAEDDPSPGMEPSLQATSPMLDLAEDEQSSETSSTSSPKTKVNPFMKDLPRAKDYKEAEDYKEALGNHCAELKQKLDDGLQQKAVYAFLAHDNMTEAQEKVQELFYLSEAIEFVIPIGRRLLKNPIREDDPYNLLFKADYLRIDIYYRLFIHDLSYANELQDDDLIPLASMIVANLSKYFKATNFMVLLINKVQEEGDIMYPSFVLQEAKTFVTKCVHRYEKETISTFICLVVNDEDEKAEDLFKSLLEHMKASDIINRGRVYNYALQKAQDLRKVHTFLSSPSLSQRYKDVVQGNDQLNGFAVDYENQLKVHRFLVDLYLRYVDLKQEIDWKFVEQHDYPYLIRCVWENHKRMMVLNDVKDYKWTPLQQKYVLTSSAAITAGGIDIIKHLLEAWPTLVNAPYKGVAALHAAVLKGNEEVIKCLLMQKELDINVRTGRLLKVHDVKKFLKDRKPALDVTAFSKGVLKCKDDSSPYAIVLKDHEELIKKLLLQQDIEVSSEGYLDARKFPPKNLSSGKKWNMNRWNMHSYQTALHMAATRRDFKAIKLLCDAAEPHRQRLRCHEEDEEDRTPLDILYNGLDKVGKDSEFSEIEKILLSKQDVKDGIDRLYRNRQVLVDAVNTILVGAALIAGVTFVGWIQPPLGYAQYYDLAVPYPAPPGTYDSYLAVQDNLGVKAFALFNSLSFFFAIATVIVGADAAFPTQRYQYIGHVVETMHLLLRRAIRFLIVSLVCVLGAFGSAAIVVLPPSLFFRKDLVLSIIIGGGVCSYALWQLLLRHSAIVQRLNARVVHIAHIIKFTSVF